MCEVKYGVPVSDGMKVAQLIRLGGKKYGTVITVLKCARRARKLHAPQNTLWTRCENNGESNVERRKAERMQTMKKKPLCRKLTRKSRVKEKIASKKRMTKARRKRLAHATTAE